MANYLAPMGLNQYEAVSGRKKRTGLLNDYIQAQIPAMRYKKEADEAKALQEREYALAERNAAMNESAAEEAAKQGKTALGIQGVGAAGTAALGAKSLGLFGGSAAATGAGGLVPAGGAIGTNMAVNAPASFAGGGGGIGATVGPYVGPALGVAATEGLHQYARKKTPEWAGRYPGGEEEWKTGEAMATRAAQGALIGSVIPGLGTGIGAGLGAGVGLLETQGKRMGKEVERFGKKTWDEGERVLETHGKRIGKEVERFGKKTLGKVWDKGEKAVEKASDKVSDVADKVWDTVSGGCITFGFLYGKTSKQARYAKVFCARHMDLLTLLGYYRLGKKFINLWKKHPVFIKPMEKMIINPFYNYMLWKLGRKKSISFLEKMSANIWLKLCRRAEVKNKTINIIPKEYAGCIAAVGRS